MRRVVDDLEWLDLSEDEIYRVAHVVAGHLVKDDHEELEEWQAE